MPSPDATLHEAPLLDVAGLVTTVRTGRGRFHGVDDVSLAVRPGRTLCVAGESGSGKSLTALSIMGLLPEAAQVEAGTLRFDGVDLLTLPPAERRRLRGRAMAMIFQEPMTALNPVLDIGTQVAEALRIHGVPRGEAHERALAMLERVRMADAPRRMRDFPHQLSGGMKQRVMIATALVHRPRLVIADEPTTALDVTLQAQVLALLRELQDEIGMAMVFVTHDLAVVAEIADEVAVMYAGRIVERAPVQALFARPAHPYTRGLLDARPRAGQTKHNTPALGLIPGRVPSPWAWPAGCRFQARCARAQPRCAQAVPTLAAVAGSAAGHEAACFFPLAAA
jgi:oligopeptide/dipeptide ABC transporter ATP-binding protein